MPGTDAFRRDLSRLKKEEKMNLIEALKTGRPVRRPIAKHLGSNEDGWLGNRFVIEELVSLKAWPLNPPERSWVDAHDLMADDWEAQEEPGIYITKKQFLFALGTVMKTLAADKKQYFIGPGGIAETPYDVLMFDGWDQLLEELKLK